jgi:hypothetical protein
MSVSPCFLADSEIAFRITNSPLSLVYGLRIDHMTYMVCQLLVGGQIDSLPHWLNVGQDYLNTPVLYALCYGYLYMVDPAALFWESWVGRCSLTPSTPR